MTSSSVRMDNNYRKLMKMSNQMAGRMSDNHSKEKIKKIIETGYDINYAVPYILNCRNFYEGFTALHFATYYQYLDSDESVIINLLLNLGADFTCKNSKSCTPLHLAYERQKQGSYSVSHDSTIKQLLSAHIEFNNPTNPSSIHGITHFHIACESKNLEVVRFFLNSGVSVNKAINLDSKIFPGYTSLHLSMLSRDKNIVQLLLNYGADCTLLNADGKSPLHLIIEKHIKVSFKSNTQNPYWPDESFNNDEILDLLLRPNEDCANPVDCYGLSYFHICCTKKENFQPHILERLIDNGVDIDAFVSFDSPICPGYTALHFAACCNLKILMLLLKRGANLMAKDANGITPLYLCLEIYKPSDISCILKTQLTLKDIKLKNGMKLSDVILKYETSHKLNKYLRFNKFNTSIPGDSPLWPGYTFLHLAVMFSHNDNSSLIDICLKHGANVTIQDKNKMTALHLAFYMKKEKCMKKILNASKNIRKNCVDKNDVSHFHVACMVNNIKIVKKLLSNQVNPDTLMKFNAQDIYRKLYSYDADCHGVKVGFAPLHIATAIKSDNLLKLLLTHGANPHIVDSDGTTWLHKAFFVNQSSHWFESYFLKHPNFLKFNPVTPGGLSHFHVACYFKLFETVQALLPLVNNINQPIDNGILTCIKKLPYLVDLGDTPLHLAVKANSVKIVHFLLNNGADVRLKNAVGMKPLYVALISYSPVPEIIRLLLKFEKDKGWFDEFGLTELHIACALNDTVMINSLLEAGEKVNSRIKSDSLIWPGLSPLYILIRKDYPKEDLTVILLLKHLLKNYVDEVLHDNSLHDSVKRQKTLSLENSELLVNLNGLTTFHISCMTGDTTIVEKFLQLGIDINEPDDDSLTPLHFALKFDRKNVVELLLNYGAIISNEGHFGRTVLHMAASHSPDSISLLLSQATEVNIETTDAFNVSVFGYLVSNKMANVNHFLEIFKKKSIVNNLSILDKMYYVCEFFSNFSSHDFELLIQYISDPWKTNELGENIIHQLVLDDCIKIDEQQKDELVEKIEILEKNGCDIDQQDYKGKTPLHLAALCHKEDAIRVLLSVGADINIENNSGHTPLDYDSFFLLDHGLEDYNDRFYTAGLHLSHVNGDYEDDEFPDYVCELDEMKKIKISKTLNLRELLTYKVLKQFLIMPKRQRCDILEFMKSQDLQQKFPDWIGLFKYQRRRAIKMEKLFNTAIVSLKTILDPTFPDLCLKPTTAYLNEDDWHNLILIAKIQ